MVGSRRQSHIISVMLINEHKPIRSTGRLTQDNCRIEMRGAPSPLNAKTEKRTKVVSMSEKRQNRSVDSGWSDGESSSSDASSSSEDSGSLSSLEANHNRGFVTGDLASQSRRQEESPQGDRFTAFRRRGKLKGPFDENDRKRTSDSGRDKNKAKQSNDLQRCASRRIRLLHRLVSKKCPLLLNQQCNVFLFVALVFWMITALSSSTGQTQISTQINANGAQLQPGSKHAFDSHHRIQRLENRVKEPHPAQQKNSVLQSAAQGFVDFIGGPKKKKKNREADLPGCVRPDWHRYSFPTCNEVHGVNLRTMILRGMRERPKRVGYVSSGLWRSVFAVIAGDEHEVAVLKMMKSKHEVNDRNMDRHRRDGLVMERLSGSPNVVDIYGYCGNSVLTEFAPMTVDDVIYSRNGRSAPDGMVTAETPEGRMHLAMGVMKGLAALHDIDGGPIVHADIQAKQFLISPHGEVKVNDFNRCRFMAYHKRNNRPCKFIIPTSPGKSRSPEEYKEDYLDEKLDVYSGANVLYGILTGNKAWYQFSSSETKEYVKKGAIPYIADELRMPNTLDAVLANLTELAYEVDPSKRISAHHLVEEMELAFRKVSN